MMTLRGRRPTLHGMNTLATDYPLLNLFWTMLWFFLFVVWIFAVFSVLADIFRSHDMGGWAKALWVLLVIIFPLFGVLIYLIARGDKMTQHAVQDAKKQDEYMRAYIQDATGTNSPANQVAQLAQLRDQGLITEEQFEQGKAKILT
jgi:ABC-type multidrug transport system fused ATPase/permease subunit